MVLQLQNIFRTPGKRLEIQESVPGDAFAGYRGLAFAGPVLVKGRVENQAGVVTLSYETSCSLTLNCDRCLTQFQRDYQYAFQHVVTRVRGEENDDCIVVREDCLDLNDLVLTDILLQLPSKFLCQEDCLGLCQRCGANLNKGFCSCQAEE